MGKNIFMSGSTKAAFAKVIYDSLMTREIVGYADVLDTFWNKEPGYHDRQKLSYAKGYGDLKKAFPEVIKALRQKDERCIEEKRIGARGKAYRYIGVSDDPLKEEKGVAIKKSLRDYVDFCINASGMLPEGWFSNYFEGTQELIDARQKHLSGSYHISYGGDYSLKNIHLLPLFNDAIINRNVLRIIYKPYNAEAFETVCHPQFLKESNGRWFVFGEADISPYHAVNLALDRVVRVIGEVKDVKYIAAEKGYYQEYFSNIIGVTHLDKAEVVTVRFRTNSEYMHSLIGTKTMHHTLRETQPFSTHADGEYGEYTMDVEPNYELDSRLLSFGSGIEVVEPDSLRKRLSEVIDRMGRHYESR